MIGLRHLGTFAAAAFAGAVAVAGEGLVAAPTAEMSSAWAPKTFDGKEFFLLTNWYSWSLFDAEVPADLPVYRACGRRYSGKLPKNAGACRHAGMKRLGEMVPEADRMDRPYRLRDFFAKSGPLSADKVYAARDLERPIELNLDGLRNPFFLDREYPLADRADYAAWKEAHPNCLGVCALNEYDGEVNNYLRGFDRLGDELMARQRKEFPAFFADFQKDPYFADRWVPELVRRASAYCFGETNIWGETSWFPGVGMLFAAAGMNPGYEASGVQPSALWTLGAAYTRGAARQFGRPWFWYTANYASLYTRDGRLANGENNYRLDPKNSWTAKTGVGRGVSESLTARLNLYGYLSGALFVEAENFHVCHSREVAPKTFEPTQEAYDFNRLYLLSQKLDRGIPLTPLALVLPAHERISVEGYPDRYDTFGPSAAVVTLVPGANRRKEGIEGGLYNSRFGEIWDVVCPELQKKEAIRSLAAYRCAVLQGVYRSGLSGSVLEAYVKDGGTLILGCEQIRRGTVSASLTGVDFPLGAPAVSSGAWFADEAGTRHPLTVPYVWERGVPTTARPFWTDEKGSVVAYERTLGKGRVITVTAQAMLPYGLDVPGILGNEGAFIRTFERVRRGEIPCELMSALFGRIQDETLPVRVEGDIQFGVNRTKNGYLVWLTNNKGVTHFMGEKATIDPNAVARARVTLKRPAAAVQDAETEASVATDGQSFEVEVVPGGWRLVRVCDLGS